MDDFPLSFETFGKELLIFNSLRLAFLYKGLSNIMEEGKIAKPIIEDRLNGRLSF